MVRVVAAPLRYRVVRKPNFRRASLTRFPYKVIYLDLDGRVEILAVSHNRRRPGYWTGRIESGV